MIYIAVDDSSLDDLGLNVSELPCACFDLEIEICLALSHGTLRRLIKRHRLTLIILGLSQLNSFLILLLTFNNKFHS
jgi:hypothetical protein